MAERGGDLGYTCQDFRVLATCRGPAWGMVRVSLQGCPSSLPSLRGWGQIPHRSSASISLLLLVCCITFVDINPTNHFIFLQI